MREDGSPGRDDMALADVGPAEIVLEIPARTEFVSLVRVVVAAAAEIEPDIAKERIEDLRVAVSEAATNAIEAHDQHGVADRIRIQCNLADDEVAVVVHDQGMGFEPDEVPVLPEPGTPDRLHHETGLGVHLIRMLTDEAEISTTPSGTDVRLVVYSKRRGRDSDR